MEVGVIVVKQSLVVKMRKVLSVVSIAATVTG